MVKRQLRVGELVDDYCPRERRLSDHAIVAMVDEEVRQVRCSACGGEHEYRGGKLPPTRRKKSAAGPPPLPPAGMVANQASAPVEESPSAPAVPTDAVVTPVNSEALAAAAPEAEEPLHAPDGPFHRRLIRATLPRVEGQVPERRIPEFTMHNNGGRGPGSGQGKSFRGGHGGPHRPGGAGGGGRAAAGHGGGRQGGGGFGQPGNKQGHSAPGGGQNRPSRHAFGSRPGRGGRKP